ncbi:conserved oligomeric Golgi complex subunit 7 [Marchantia polymorpha subsp. ruderalis]|uniref:Conserved oligomeric Golgi complex subunit 7 n=4 Tax=Marchantia polymorpha TaxID=3197 RepID=A0A176W7F1_MARPO|nr:hypothetical protein AXG93_1335s1450 [Marchantia polymorpha subsp. ruderalis]PTQ47920.1 hypothetical protein MARPO_0007s0274 [Marchantia polymorpha]BBN04234.1 hypothetical protein Mp_3g02860 [Marchantia polymorpha subsp. ruderalis]|eukprot:PTQ47920.1 hypothetical protein MARPO_0007s0274 [Marchantia polymorpha]
MMVDLALFGDEKYDAKAWLNAACRDRLPDDPVDRYLTDLEMKLQLMAETITADLDEKSTGALLRVPRASRDVLRVRDDAITLRATVSAILAKLKQADGTSAESVAALARVDVVKQRMEAAHETLQDAAGLAKLSASVEEVFASGDLPRAAETLANMRRCLSVVGEVPEFANVKRQLEVLEDRLEAMVQPKLAEALSQRKVDSTQGLRDILITIGRYSSLEQHYTRVRVRPLRRLWEEFESGKGGLPIGKSATGVKLQTLAGPNSVSVSFAEWLPKFYDEVLVQLEQELKWCTVAFPDDYKLLVPRLLVETMSAISSSFGARIEAATEETTAEVRASGGAGENSGVEKGRSSRLGLLIALHNMTGEFAKNVQHLLSGFETPEVARVLKAVYVPYEGYKRRYGELERAQLLSEIASMDIRGAVPRGVGQRGVELSETVGRIEASIPQLILVLEAAVERCLSFTGGSEAEAFLRTLDEVMLHYLASLMEMLKSMRPLCGVDRGNHDASKRDSGPETGGTRKDSSNVGSSNVDLIPEEEEWAIVQGALHFLTAADVLTARASVFEASLRSVLTRLAGRLQLSTFFPHHDQSGVGSTGAEAATTGGPGALDMTVLRLGDLPDNGRRLMSLLEQAQDPRFHTLPQTAQRIAAFSEAVNELVYEVLISKVRLKLADVARLPVWCAEEEDNAFDLPNFSAYPLAYVTSIGEYLFTLPQQLEPVAAGAAGMGGSAMGGDGAEESVDEAQFLATEWMFKVAEGATALYIEQIRGIQALNERGAQQLAADIEYLCNVLSALSMTTPPVLSTFHACVAAPREKLIEMAKQEGTHYDIPSLRLVCKMRHVPIE